MGPEKTLTNILCVCVWSFFHFKHDNIYCKNEWNQTTARLLCERRPSSLEVCNTRISCPHPKHPQTSVHQIRGLHVSILAWYLLPLNSNDLTYYKPTQPWHLYFKNTLKWKHKATISHKTIFINKKTFFFLLDKKSSVKDVGNLLSVIHCHNSVKTLWLTDENTDL